MHQNVLWGKKCSPSSKLLFELHPIRESIHSSHNMRVALNCGAHSSRSRALWDWVPALDYALRIGLVRGFSQV